MKRILLVFLWFVVPSMAMGLTYEPVNLDAGGTLKMVETVDVDGDGSLDIVAAIRKNNGSTVQREIAIFFANKSGMYPESPSTSLIVPESACAFDFSDIDNNGTQEIILIFRTKVVSYSPTCKGFGKASLILAQGCDIFFPDEKQLLYLDLVRNWRGDEAVELMLLNYGKLEIFEKTDKGFAQAETLQVSMQGKLLMAAESGDKEIDRYRLGFSLNIPTLDLADYNADGDLDLYITMENVVNVFVQSDGRFKEKKIFHHKYNFLNRKEETDFLLIIAQVKDIDGDQYGDLIIHMTGGKITNFLTQIRIYKGSKNGLSKTPDYEMDRNRLTSHLIFSDADGDGHLDLITPSINFNIMAIVKLLLTQKVYPEYQLFLFNESEIFHEKPDNQFKTTLIIDEFKFPTPIVHGFMPQFGHDFNQDGKPDLLAEMGTKKMGIFPGNGSGKFARQPLATITAPATYLIQIFDADKDNNISDLLLWYVQPDEEGKILLFLAK